MNSNNGYFLVYFLVFFCGVISNVTTTTSDGSGTSPSLRKAAIIKQCLKDLVDDPDIDLDKLSKKDLISVLVLMAVKYNALNENFIQERKCRLRFQSLIDLVQLCECLFTTCWPTWAGHRTDNDRSKDAWKTLLLNIEDPIICDIKKFLHDNNLLEDIFVDELTALDQARNKKAQHGELFSEEQEAAYEHLKNTSTSTQILAIEVIFTAGKRCASCNRPIAKDEIPQDVLSMTNEARKNFTVLEIPPNGRLSLYDESTIRSDVENILKLANFSAESKALAYYVQSGTFYVVFKTFEEAFAVWSHRGMMKFYTNYEIWADQKRIMDKTNKHFERACHITITATRNYGDFKNFRDLGPMNSYQWLYGNVKTKTIMYIYRNFITLLIDSEILKENISDEYVLNVNFNAPANTNQYTNVANVKDWND